MDAETAAWARLIPAPRDLEATVPTGELWQEALATLNQSSELRRQVKGLTGIDIEKLPAGYERMAEIIAKATAVALQDFIEDRVLALYVLNPASNRFYRLPPEALVPPTRGVTSYCGQDTSERAERTAEYSWATGHLNRICCPEWLWPLSGQALLTTRREAKRALEQLRTAFGGEVSVVRLELAGKSEVERIFGTSIWSDRSRWPRDDLRPSGRSEVFLGRAIDDQLIHLAPPGTARNEARFWAGQRICKAAKAGNVRTSLDSRDSSAFAGTGNAALDRARLHSILAECGVLSSDGGWVPLFIDAVDLNWLIADLQNDAAVAADATLQTRFEADARKREAKAAKLALQLPNSPDWDLLVTLLWIGSRDFKWIAPHVVASQTSLRRVFDGVSAGGLVSWAGTCLKQLPEPIESNPEKKLLDRLVSGRVVASGLEQGIGPRREIPRRQWLDLHFPHSGPDKHDGLSCAYSGDSNDPRTHFWSRLAFDSASVMEAFPPRAAETLPGPDHTMASEPLVRRPMAHRPPDQSDKARRWLAANYPNERPPSVKGAARAAGVSRSTMQRTLKLLSRTF